MITDKLEMAEKDVYAAITLGTSVIFGYITVDLGEFLEAYYQLNRWQKKLGKGNMTTLDKLLARYEYELGNYKFLADKYVQMRDKLEDILRKKSGESYQEDLRISVEYLMELLSADDDVPQEDMSEEALNHMEEVMSTMTKESEVVDKAGKWAFTYRLAKVPSVK